MSGLKDFSKDTVVYGLGKGIKKFIGVLLLPVYTRALSPAEFGVLDTMGTFLFFITTFFNFGLDTASSFFYFKTKHKVERGKILFTVFILRIIVVVPAVILSFFTRQISWLLFDSYEYASVLLITLILIPVSMVMSEQELIYRFNRQPWRYNILTILKSLMNIVGGILLVVHYDLGVWGAQTASLISSVVVITWSVLSYTRKQYYYSFSLTWAKSMLKFGFPLIWAGVAVWIYSSSDRFFLLHYRNLTEIGYYSIGSTFSQPLGLLNMAVQMSLGVLFWDVYHKESMESKPKTKKLMREVVYLYLAVASIVTLALSIFSYDLVRFITTPKYIAGIIVIPILLVSAIYGQLTQIVPVGISISQKTWHYTWIVFVAAAVNAGLNFLIIPIWGYVGAALTTLAAFWIYFALSDWVSSRFFYSGFSRIKVHGFLLVVFIISATAPFLFILEDISLSWWIKIVIFSLACFLPFIFRFVSFGQMRSLYIKLLKYKK